MAAFGLLDVLLRKLGSTFISMQSPGSWNGRSYRIKRAIRACCPLLVIWAVGWVMGMLVLNEMMRLEAGRQGQLEWAV
jgi:hypothetical protein